MVPGRWGGGHDGGGLCVETGALTVQAGVEPVPVTVTSSEKEAAACAAVELKVPNRGVVRARARVLGQTAYIYK